MAWITVTTPLPAERGQTAHVNTARVQAVQERSGPGRAQATIVFGEGDTLLAIESVDTVMGRIRAAERE